MAKVEQVREGRETEPYRDGFEIERDTLTDGSVAFNVIHRLEGRGEPALIRFACTSEKAAGELADVLADNTSWIEVE